MCAACPNYRSMPQKASASASLQLKLTPLLLLLLSHPPVRGSLWPMVRLSITGRAASLSRTNRSPRLPACTGTGDVHSCNIARYVDWWRRKGVVGGRSGRAWREVCWGSRRVPPPKVHTVFYLFIFGFRPCPRAYCGANRARRV
jgi:hypothetical protein